MTGQYYLNLEEFSLEKFKHTLESGEVLPARQILKEDIEARFEVLSSMGIQNLSDLISTLSTKHKMEVFSQQSGLSIEYLIILRREVKSFIPKPRYLREIPGVNCEDVERLAAVGIQHSRHLFERGQTKENREELSATTGISRENLLELIKLSDLARIRGLGPAFVRLFYESGADTIESLSGWNPDTLFQTAHAVNKERKITKVVPPLKDFILYVAMAQDLDKAIEFD